MCTPKEKLNKHEWDEHKAKQGEPCPGCDNTIFLTEYGQEKCVGYKCNLCKFELKIPEHIKEIFVDNKNKDLPDKVYICGECKFAFPSEGKFNEHKDAHTPNDLSCQKCNIRFENIQQFYDHSLKEHNIGPLHDKEVIGKGNLFLNVLAYQVDTLLTNFQQVLLELANIKKDMKDNTSQKSYSSPQKNEVEKMLETVETKLKTLEDE